MSLSRIQSLRLSAVMEDCSDQLDILGHILTMQINKEQDPAAAQEKIRLTKLRRDCQDISQQVFKLHLELEEKQTFSSVQQMVEEEELRREDKIVRRETNREVRQRKEAVHKLNEEIQQKTETVKELDSAITDLHNQMPQQSFEMKEKMKTVEKIIELQLEQLHSETKRTEVLMEKQVELLRKQLKEEVRAHKESEKFLQNQHQELQQRLQQWQQSTKQMLQEKEQQVNSVSCKRTVNLDKLTDMRSKFREMEQVVMEDREEQEKLRQQQAEATAATKLQAWWRGCMVRRGLGSFKKAEEGKKGKKKKEGKKKKK